MDFHLPIRLRKKNTDCQPTELRSNCKPTVLKPNSHTLNRAQWKICLGSWTYSSGHGGFWAEKFAERTQKRREVESTRWTPDPIISGIIHPWRSTWNIIMEVRKIFLSKSVICKVPAVNLPRCIQIKRISQELPSSKASLWVSIRQIVSVTTTVFIFPLVLAQVQVLFLGKH